MASVSTASVINLFKQVYGDLTDLTPKDQHLSRAIPFSQKQKVGQSYVEAVVLTAESGITFSSSTSAFQLNAPRAGVVAQSTVVPYISVLPSIVPWGVMSRSAGGSVQAFYDATKFIVRNNLKSHEKFQEIIRLYGQAALLLGTVSYATATYRGVGFVTGTGTLTSGGGIVAPFTNGISLGSAQSPVQSYNSILLSPGQFASGIWVGMEGVKVNQVDSTGIVVATGSLVSVESELGWINVDFVPIAATSATSHRLCFDGMQSANDYIGVQKILSTQSGNLFGINTSNYSLWQGSTTNLQQSRLTLPKYLLATANAVNKSGLEGDLTCFINPRSFSTLSSDEAGYRMYDSSYKPQKAQDGFESIEFFSQNGKTTFVSHRMVKEGDAFALHLPDWSRSGSSEVSFVIPGMANEVVFPLENQAGYAFRSYSDQYIFCHAPARSLYISGINDSSLT